MTAVREIMTHNAECIGERQTMADAAKKMANLDVGALPICGDDDRLKGMLTDRDIVVSIIAQDKNPQETYAGVLATGTPVFIGADDPAEKALETMESYNIRRLPVLDGHTLVGMVSQGDVARHLGKDAAGDVVESVSKAPPGQQPA